MDILQALRLKNIYGTPNRPPQFPGMYDDNPMRFEEPANNGTQSIPTSYDEVQYGPPPNSYESPTPISPPTPPPQNAGVGNIAELMSRMYTPENDASDRYNKLISQYPTRESPSMMRRLGAMLVDYTKGAKQGQQFYDAPYNEKVEDWKNQVGPAGTAANLERYNNANERSMSYQTASNTLKERSLAEKTANDEARIKMREESNKIRQWKNDHPNMKFVFPRGGNVYAINPITREKVDMGIATGTVSDADKYEFQQDNAIERIQETGKQSRLTEDTRQSGRENIQDQRAWELGIDNETGKSIQINKITGETRPIMINGKSAGPISKPSSTVNKPELPGQSRIRIYNKASQFVNANPELAQFIELGNPGINDVKILPPSTGWFGNGPTEEQHKAIIKAIYGGEIDRMTGPTSQTGDIFAPLTDGNMGGKPTSGPIRVRDKNGKIGTYKGTAEEALASGYQIIGG